MCSNRRLRRAGPLLLLSGVVAALVLLPLLLPEKEVFVRLADTWIPHGASGWLTYVCAAACLICLAVPRQIISFVGGYAFGAVAGAVLGTVGVTLGCIAAFSLARRFGQRLVERRYGSRLRRFDSLLRESPFLLAVLLRLFPSGNNLVFSLVAGVSRIPALPFWAGSCIGYIPQNLIFALLGSGVRIDPLWNFGIGAAVCIVSGGLAWILYRRFRPLVIRLRSLEAENTAALPGAEDAASSAETENAADFPELR